MDSRIDTLVLGKTNKQHCDHLDDIVLFSHRVPNKVD